MNTISTNCDLSKGEISKAILKKAGKKIQEDIYKRQNYTNFLGGHLYITNRYELKCKAVYHTALTETAKEVECFIFFISNSALFHHACLYMYPLFYVVACRLFSMASRNV